MKTNPLLIISIVSIIVLFFIIYGITKSSREKIKGSFILALMRIILSTLLLAYVVALWLYIEPKISADSIYQLAAIPLLMISYWLLGLNVIAIAKWKSKGAPLRRKNGLHVGLLIGFLLGLYLGVTSWIVIIFPGESGLTSSGGNTLETLVICVAVTLALGLLVGTGYGLKTELRKYP